MPRVRGSRWQLRLSADNYITSEMSKVRKVYNLRKTSNIRGPSQPEESRMSEFQPEAEPPKVAQPLQKNASMLSQNARDSNAKADEAEQYQVEGEELVVDRLQLSFNVRLHDIERQPIKVRNVGNSAVYLQFVFKNSPKINASGFKDSKLKFYCHYENNVIKPNEEVTFIFSFLSEFPGNFTEQVQIHTQPSLKTKIPNLKLNGYAFIEDEWQATRNNFTKDTQERILKEEVREILSDVVDQVKLPPPPRPNVADLKVAEIEFQKRNSHLNLFFNAYLHNWFNQLFKEVSLKGGVQEADLYWDQSVDTLKELIINATFLDEVEKKCYSDRLEHYCYLSLTPLPNKSELYQTVYEFVSTAAYHLGGDYVDAARKELDMWEVPFREPTEHDTPEDLKARKEEIDKVKAEWLKKAKKKKWGEEEDRQMVNEFKKKVQARTTDNLLQRFTNFEEGAEFIKAREFLKKSTFSLQEYHHLLERLKTVKEYPLDGKKILLKWHLKLKENSEEKLKELDQYLTKKKEEQKRLEQQKKNDGAKKKKAPPKPKKKGQKQEDEQKPLFFDFLSLLDEENWNGFTQTFRVIMEKQPFLLLIGITYGPRTGRALSQYSIQFLLEHLKTLESSIQFMPHDQLPHLAEKIENETIGEGSILLLQNLNFLPWEVTQEEVVHQAEEGHPATITKRKLLHSQIRDFFDQLGLSIDVLINEDRFLEQVSGFAAYLNKEVVLGTQWWRYVGLSMRVIDSTVVFGLDFTPENYILLRRLVQSTKQIYLAGQSAAKFYLAKHKLDRLGNIEISKSERDIISHFLTDLEAKGHESKIVIPSDFTLEKHAGQVRQRLNFNGSQTDTHEYAVIDIGDSSVAKINQIHQGSVFLLGETAIKRQIGEISTSLTKIIKSFFKKQEAKRQRHAQQSSLPSGINYSEDLVIYLVGIDEASLEKIELREKKAKQISEEGEEQNVEQEEEAESDKRKIDLVSDFHLSSLDCLCRLWRGKFNVGLKDVSKYAVVHDD